MFILPIRGSVQLSMPSDRVDESQPGPRITHAKCSVMERRISEFCQFKIQQPVTLIADVSACGQTFQVSAADQKEFILRFLPFPTTRLLRQERVGLAHEMDVIRLLSDSQIYTPRVVSHASGSIDGYWPHILLQYGTSVSLSTLRPLDDAQKATVKKSLEEWLVSVSSIESSAFGTFTHESDTLTWRNCFRAMLESTLREAEDMMVGLPYDNIRDCVRRYGYALDHVTTPRLVIPRAGCWRNIMVEPITLQVTGLVDYSSAVWGDPDMVVYVVDDEGGRIPLKASTYAISSQFRLRSLL